ncbi:MAG: GAF domain-containing protein, partial [Gemmatimonadaceae bacterium]
MAALAAVGDLVVGDLLCVDIACLVVYANPVAVLALGELGPRHGLTGTPLAELMPAVLSEPLRQALDRMFAGSGSEELRLPEHDTHPYGGRHCRLAPIPGGAAVVIAPRTGAAAPISGVVRQLNQSLEFERIVALVARHAVELLGGHHAALFTIDGDELVVASIHGEASLTLGQRLPLGLTFSGEAIRAGRTMRARDVASQAARWPALAGDAAAADPAAAMHDTVIAAPLLIGGRPIGAVCVSGHATRDFDERDELLLAELADHAAIAVENARLYSAAARAARHAGILADTASALTSSVAPNAVYEGVSRVATNALGATGVCVLLAEPDSGQVTIAHCDLPLAHSRDAMIRRFWQLDSGIAMRSGVPCFVTDLDVPANADGAGSRLPLEGALSYAVLPLVAEGRPRGILVLRYTRRQRFDTEERHLLGDFATQVAVAMRNAVLVADLERRAARLAAVARVQQAIARTDIDEVYAELQRAVAAVVDAPAFAVLAADDAAAVFSPRYVVVDGNQLAGESIAASPARDAVAAEACRRGEPLLERPPVWSWSAAVQPEPGREWRHAGAGLVAPIRHGTRVLGVLHVQSYRADAYAPEDVDLVAIIARQAGAALELARLFGAEQRERELAEASAEIARLALGTATAQAVADDLLTVVEGVVPSLGKALGVIRPGGVLEYVGGIGEGVRYRGFNRPVSESLARLLRPPGIIDIPDLSVVVIPDERLHPPEMAALLVPLVARDRVIGMLVSGTTTGTVLTAERREALLRLAAPMALALDVLLLNEEERRRMERERMLAAALATMDQPVFVLAPDGRVRYANQAAVREYGYPHEAL